VAALLAPCPWVVALRSSPSKPGPAPRPGLQGAGAMGSGVQGSVKVVVVGLTEAKGLYAGEQLICSNCTSFMLLQGTSMKPGSATSSATSPATSAAVTSSLTVVYTTASGFLVCLDLRPGWRASSAWLA